MIIIPRNDGVKEVPHEIKEMLRQGSEFRLVPQAHVDYLKQLKESGFEPKVIYDIGSCILHWTNEAKVFWPEAKYILFDAFDSAEFLYEGYDYHIGVISNQDDKDVDFYQSDFNPGVNSYYRDQSYSDFFPIGSAQKRKAMTLDTIVKMKGFPKPDLIKIDIQGCEGDLIEGGKETLSAAKRLIVEMPHVAVNEGAPLVGETLPKIEALGFKCTDWAFSPHFSDADYSFVKIDPKETLEERTRAFQELTSKIQLILEQSRRLLHS